MQEALFEHIESKIIESINTANASIRIAMAWFTNNVLFDRLINVMSNRDIKVELILLDDVINWQPYAPNFNEINNHKNGCVRIASRSKGFMHHKFCIIDSDLLITGSYNWTYYAENRNVENVVVTNDKHLINSFSAEFKRLQQYYNAASDCPRYSKEVIEQLEYVDYEMLNRETQAAVEARQLPYCPVYKTHTTVKVIQKRHNPVASFNVGVNAVDGNETDVLGVIIPRWHSLPCTLSAEFQAYADERDHLQCDILYGSSRKASLNTRLKTRPIKEITEGCSAEEFTIQIEITLNTNGYLLAEICCKETKKAIQLNATKSELVRYEEE